MPGVADWKSPPLVARRSERISDSNDPNKAPARFWRILVLIGLALALIAAGVIAYLQRPKPGPRLTLAPVKFDQVPTSRGGWRFAGLLEQAASSHFAHGNGFNVLLIGGGNFDRDISLLKGGNLVMIWLPGISLVG